MSANMLNAVAKLYLAYGESMNDELFIEKLGAYSVKSLARIAKERGPGSTRMAEAMVMIYNGKKKDPKNQLSIRKLYEKSSIPNLGKDEMLNDEAEKLNTASDPE